MAVFEIHTNAKDLAEMDPKEISEELYENMRRRRPMSFSVIRPGDQVVHVPQETITAQFPADNQTQHVTLPEGSALIRQVAEREKHALRPWLVRWLILHNPLLSPKRHHY